MTAVIAAVYSYLNDFYPIFIYGVFPNNLLNSIVSIKNQQFFINHVTVTYTI